MRLMPNSGRARTLAEESMMFDGNVTSRLSHWVVNQLIQDVPEESGLCEYDCRRLQCTEREWRLCSRRLSRAAGELTPGDENDNAIIWQRESAGI